ncbi:hypothetical protein ACHAWF_004259 [Thalassiosira exigua]
MTVAGTDQRQASSALRPGRAGAGALGRGGTRYSYRLSTVEPGVASADALARVDGRRGRGRTPPPPKPSRRRSGAAPAEAECEADPPPPSSSTAAAAIGFVAFASLAGSSVRRLAVDCRLRALKVFDRRLDACGAWPRRFPLHRGRGLMSLLLLLSLMAAGYRNQVQYFEGERLPRLRERFSEAAAKPRADDSSVSSTGAAQGVPLDGDDVADDYRGPTFVFVMGLEGTGHHLIDAILRRSPNMNLMRSVGPCSRGGGLGTISAQFFREDSKKVGWGLFNPSDQGEMKLEMNAERKYQLIVGMFKEVRERYKQYREMQWNKKQVLPLEQQQQQQQQGQQQQVQTDNRPPSPPFHIAINANSCDGPSLMSYPTYQGPDRALQNFNLDIYYRACTDAEVRCAHVYIYRDPYLVLRSVQRRRFNSNVLDAIRLYVGELQQIHSQMASHPNRTVGCFGFLDPEGAKRDEDWEWFRTMFGWDSSESFRQPLSTLREQEAEGFEIGAVPDPMTEGEREALVPPRLGVLMRAMEDVHRRVVDLCYASLGTAGGGRLLDTSFV